MPKLLLLKIYILTFFLVSNFNQQVQAQSTSNSGTNFWVGYTGHIDGTVSDMSLYITSTVNTTATVSIPLQNITATYNITANAVTIVPIASSAYSGNSDLVEDKGIQVTSVQPVVVYAHIYSQNRSGATLVLPTTTLGREYYTMNYLPNPSRNDQYNQFMVVATDDNTTVEITPKATTRAGKPANVPYQVTLKKGQVYQVQSYSDLTGSKILSVSNNGSACKKIAVFSGHTFVPIGCNGASSADNLYQQLYPLSTWGKNFITAPLKTRIGGEFYRIMAGSDNTTVKVNTSTYILNKGGFAEFQSSVPQSITADKPITLAQYARTQSCDNVTGDPEMIIINPIEQTLNLITVYSSPFYRITGHYINVVMKTADTPGFTIDGSPAVFTQVSADPTYSYAQITVAAGNHTLKAAGGFNAIAYGFGQVESYGYSAGANIKNLEQYITADKNNFCGPGTVNFTANLTYSPSSIKWYFGDNTTATQANPSHTFTNSGKYTVSLVTVKPNAVDCDSKDSTTYEVTINPLINAELGPDKTVCSDNKITMGPASQTGVIYSWTPAIGLSAVNIANPQFSLTNNTDLPITRKYYLNAINPITGCSAKDSISVTVNPFINRAAGADIKYCSGQSGIIGLPALAGYTYQWSPATGLANATAAQTTVTLINLTDKAVVQEYIRSTTRFGCILTDTVRVTINPLSLAEAGPDLTMCSGDNIKLGVAAQPNTSYSWSPATNLSSSTVANPDFKLINTTNTVITRKYYLTVTNLVGNCITKDSVTVTVKPTLNRLAGPDLTVCGNQTGTIGTAAIPGYSYQWAPAIGLSNPTGAQTTVTLSNITNGTTAIRQQYIRSATFNGCTVTDTVLVTANPIYIPEGGSNATLCSGEARTLGMAGVPNVSFVWAPSTNLSNATVANPQFSFINNTNAAVTLKYYITATHSTSGCVAKDSVEITVKPAVNAAAGPDVVFCTGQPATIGLPAIAGYNYQWSPATGLGNATAAQTSIALPNLSGTPQTFTYTRTATFNGCSVSDVVLVTVNPLPDGTILGSKSVCPSITGVSYFIQTPQNFTFKWGVKGGVIATNTGSQITVDWGSANNNALVYAVPTNTFGCVGDTLKFKVTINQLLIPDKPNGPAELCRKDKSNVLYSILGTRGSLYTWGIVGGEIASGQGTNQVRVNWNESGKGKLWIRESSTTATDLCFGISDTLYFKLIPNTTFLSLTSVSTEQADEKNILLKYLITTRDTYPSDKKFNIQRKLPTQATWQTITQVGFTGTAFRDLVLPTDQNSYEYRLEGTNTCDSTLTSNIHSSILLAASGEQATGLIKLNWNPYTGWPNEPVKYEIWKKVNDENNYRLAANLTTTQNNLNLSDDIEGFSQCYRIRAVAGTKESWSNTVCLEFENPISLPNIITPNGDGKNDQLVVKNLRFYPNSQLKIYNRLGQEVYKTDNYQNEWGGDKLSTGTYYYLFTTKIRPKVYKGWVEIVR